MTLILLEGRGERQLPLRCLTGGCLVTSSMRAYCLFSKTYPRKGGAPPGGAVAAPVPAPLEALQPRARRSAAWPAQGAAGGAPQRALTALARRARTLRKGRGLAGGAPGQTAGDSPPKRL